MIRRIATPPRFYPPLVILVIAGIALRAWATLAVSPAIFNLLDSYTYIVYAHTSLFDDVIHPAGYAGFLKVLGWASSSAFAPICLQHVIGVTTGLLLYATVRRVGAPRWAATIPAGFVLLSLDQVTLEHQYMPETLFTFLLVASGYCAAVGLARAHEDGALGRFAGGTLIAAGMLLGLAAYMRTVALLLAPFLVLWALLALPRPWWRSRVVGAGVAAAGVLVLALAYSVAHEIKSGYFGFTPGSGWAIYVRTAQFADCSKFTPPPGTRGLCERTDSDARPGPDFYAWDARSPARRLFGRQPFGGDKLGAFAREAIVHQPLSYVETVFNDVVRFFAPAYNSDRLATDPGFQVLDFNRRVPGQEVGTMRAINRWYSDTRLRVREGQAQAVQDAQQLLRVQGVILLQLIILACAGLLAARGVVRRGIVLLLGAGVLQLVIPAATVVYTVRYSVPAAGTLAAAAALAAWALWQRATQRLIRMRAPSPSVTDREHEREPAGVG